MTEVSVNPKERTADFVVDDGCPTCGGKLQVRITEGHAARGYCAVCHTLTRAYVTFNGNVLQLAAPVTAQA